MKNQSTEVVLTIPGDLQYIHILGRCACALISEIADLYDAEYTLYNLELAIQEIGVNIVTHAYAERNGRIVMTAMRNDDRAQITVTLEDKGRTFNPSGIPKPRLGSLQEHGYGLFLANELLDGLHYETRPDGNRWHLTKSYCTDKQKELHCD